jgi:hypothetical protein
MEALTKDRRNQIFRALAKSVIDPRECELYGKESDEFETIIRHVPTGSVFTAAPLKRKPGIFEIESRNFVRVQSRIGYDPGSETTVLDDPSAINAQILKWASDVRKWADTPDLWELARSGNAVIPGERSPDSDNTPFTPDEQQVISSQLKAIGEAVKKANDLTAEQSAKLDEKFEEAEKASRRMGRKDWGLLFGGAVFSLILADVITPGVAGHVLLMVQHGLGHLFLDGTPTIGGILGAGQD